MKEEPRTPAEVDAVNRLTRRGVTESMARSYVRDVANALAPKPTKTSTTQTVNLYELADTLAEVARTLPADSDQASRVTTASHMLGEIAAGNMATGPDMEVDLVRIGKAVNR